MANKVQLERVMAEAKEIKELVLKAEDSEKKSQAIAYCDQSIAACELAIEVMSKKSTKKAAPKKEEPADDDWLD